ncbi:MAG: HAMP domain-containing histidine kinase [Xanthomonadales bacterium]|jgi:two-component system OmpR family sensor kinase|nr:HAMP domain-containing histidine kinase [Xanthomonadales bacterium]
MPQTPADPPIESLPREALLAQVIELRQRAEEQEATARQLERYVADLHQLLGQRDHAVEAASRAAQVRADVLANISHDFMEPLNAIIGFAQVLLRTPLSPDARDAVSRMFAAGMRVTRMVEDMLMMARMQLTPELQTGVVALGPLVQQALQAVDPLRQERSIALSPWPDALQMAQVRADPTRLQLSLEQLLRMLLQTPGAQRLRLDCSADQEEGRAALLLQLAVDLSAHAPPPISASADPGWAIAATLLSSTGAAQREQLGNGQRRVLIRLRVD